MKTSTTTVNPRPVVRRVMLLAETNEPAFFLSAEPDAPAVALGSPDAKLILRGASENGRVPVRVHGLPIMGGFGIDGDTPSVVDPDAPIVHIRGLVMMGGVGVEYRARKHQQQDEDEDD
jgi:hypothetical protein